MNYVEFKSHIDVSRETFEALDHYKILVLKWQKSINLISPHSIDEIWWRHIIDSCQFANHIVSRETSIIDIGSGGGFPGIVLAILGYHHLTLVESDNRKGIFLNEVARELGLSITIIPDRIENILVDSPDMITARACASLEKLIEFCYHFLSPSTICLFAKGENYDKEIKLAKQDWDFDHQIHPSITHSQAVLLELTTIRSR